MEAFIEIFTEGTKLIGERDTSLNKNRKYYHLYIKDNDGINTQTDFWDMIIKTLREMEQGKHAYIQDEFPNFAQFKSY